MAHPAIHTAEELVSLDIPGKVTELVRGTLMVREPPGYLHGRVTLRLGTAIAKHVDAHGLGIVLAAETGFKLSSNPDTVRAPDVAFITQARAPDAQLTGYPALAPDLAVEVLSPSDRAGYVLSKVGDWLDAGSRLVWVIDPVKRTARVYRGDGGEIVMDERGALDGEDVLPGFSCPLVSIL